MKPELGVKCGVLGMQVCSVSNKVRLSLLHLLPRSSPAPKVFQEPAPLLAGFKMVHLSIVGESVSVILDTVSVTDRVCFF